MPSAEMGKVADGDSVTEEVSFPARGSEMPKGDRMSAVGRAQSLLGWRRKVEGSAYTWI